MLKTLGDTFLQHPAKFLMSFKLAETYRSVSVCPHISQGPHIQTSLNFLCMAHIAVVSSAIRYVLPVLWMMLCLSIMASNRRH